MGEVARAEAMWVDVLAELGAASVGLAGMTAEESPAVRMAGALGTVVSRVETEEREARVERAEVVSALRTAAEREDVAVVGVVGMAEKGKGAAREAEVAGRRV